VELVEQKSVLKSAEDELKKAELLPNSDPGKLSKIQSAEKYLKDEQQDLESAKEQLKELKKEELD